MPTTKEITLYTAAELKDLDTRAFEKAHEDFTNRELEDIPWRDETFDSLKGILDAAGITLTDYNLSDEAHRSYIRIYYDDPEYIDEIIGNRALAWIENNLLGKLRVPYGLQRNKDLVKYGKYYYPGKIPPCPFTGYCADDDYLDDLLKNIRSGMTIKESFLDLANTYSRLLSNEIEYIQSEEYFIETAEANEYQYTEDGEQW